MGGFLLLEWVLLSAAILATAPLKLAIRADINREPTFEVMLRVYGFRMRFYGLVGAKGEITIRRKDGQSLGQLPLKRLFFFWYYLFVGAQWSRAEANCRVGTGDALTTALAAGAISALLHTAGAGIGLRVRVWPEFSGAFFALSLRCILSFRGGDIIRAGVKALARDGPKVREKSADGPSG